MDSKLGDLLVALTGYGIELAGTNVVVFRPMTVQGQTPSQRTLRCIPDAKSAGDSPRLDTEGAMNMADPMPHDFIFPDGSDIKERDYFMYAGFSFRVLSVTPDPLVGGRSVLHAAAVRV